MSHSADSGWNCQACKQRPGNFVMGGVCRSERAIAREIVNEHLCDVCMDARLRAEMDQAWAALKTFKSGITE